MLARGGRDGPHGKKSRSTLTVVIGTVLCLALLSLVYAMWTTASVTHSSEIGHKILQQAVDSRKDSSPSADVKPSLRRDQELVADVMQRLAALQKVVDDHKAMSPSSGRFESVGTEQRPSAQLSLQKPDAVEGFHLPGAKNHPILQLSDAELRHTSFDKLMAPYGEAQGGGSCSKDFGNELVNRWRSTRLPNCKASESSGANPDALQSSIDCYLVKQTRHHGNGDNICVMNNVAVDLKIFGDQRFTSPIIEQYVGTRHMQQPYPKVPRGFIKADCEPTSQWQADKMPGWNVDLTVNALQKLDQSSAQRARKDLCAVWIDHPVMFQQRDTFANFFHDSEDFVNVFLAMAVLRWTPADAQVMLTDLYPEGPFWTMWERVFSHGQPAMTAWDIKQTYGHLSERGHVCFKQLAIGIYGPAAPTTIASWDTPCSHTALVRAYSDFVVRSLGLQSQTHYAQSEPSKTVTVTFMTRRPTKQWPERKFCNDTHSFFLCRYWDKFGERSLGRMIRNDAEVVRALKELEEEHFENGAEVRVQAVDYNELSLEDQIRTDIGTDIMVGPHGAGLMHNIFMRDRAQLIELFIDGSGANRHFHNLANWYGRKYRGESMSNPVNLAELLRMVREGINRMDLNSY